MTSDGPTRAGREEGVRMVTNRAEKTDLEARTGLVARRRADLLLGVVLVTNVLGLALGVLFPGTEETAFTLPVVAERQSTWLPFFAVLGTNLVVAVIAGAAAVLVLTTSRGGTWGTVGATIAVIGAGCYAVGIGTWVTLVHLTDPDLMSPAAAERFLAAFAADIGRTYGVAMVGAIGVLLGTLAMAIGLGRARTVPLWVPILMSVAAIATFLVPTSGWGGLLVETPNAVAAIAVGVAAWRMVRSEG